MQRNRHEDCEEQLKNMRNAKWNFGSDSEARTRENLHNPLRILSFPIRSHNSYSANKMQQLRFYSPQWLYSTCFG